MKKQITSQRNVDWEEKVKHIQTDVRFTLSDTLNGSSPAQIICKYDPRTKFYKWHNQISSNIAAAEGQMLYRDKNYSQINFGHLLVIYQINGLNTSTENC